ncbi:MAG: prenyltransferase/squalene oxidase repeat-containing protein [Candidatus Thorarchaeota archaeon]
MNTELHYDFENYLLTNGSIADKMRLIAAGFGNEQLRNRVITDLEASMNKDGGIRFGYKPEAPSSVKETAEVLVLLANFADDYSSMVERMVSFLVSRQKKDGGFAETLNLDPHIEDKWGAAGGRNWYPVGKSITWLTGKALEALCLVEYDDVERLRRARDFLLYSQNEDGHWPDFKGQNESDPLATGNILEGLRAMKVDSRNKVIVDGRAALMQHLKDCIESKSTFDMVDLPAVGVPESEQEKELIRDGLKLIMESQNEDGGWIPFGAKKSDPELTSLLILALQKCKSFC